MGRDKKKKSLRTKERRKIQTKCGEKDEKRRKRNEGKIGKE